MVTTKISGPRTAADKTHIGPVNLLYITILKIRKIKPNLYCVQQKPKIFRGDWSEKRYFNPYYAEFIIGNILYISQLLFNTMTAADLVMQGARASAPIALTWLYWTLQVSAPEELTYWGRVTHICVSKLGNHWFRFGLSLDRCQAIIRTNAGILLIGPLGTNFTEILIKIYTFSFKKIHLIMMSRKWQPFCFRLNMLMNHYVYLFPFQNGWKVWHEVGVQKDICWILCWTTSTWRWARIIGENAGTRGETDFNPSMDK